MCVERAGVYVHVPFCSAICPYCDFAVVRDQPERHTAYVDALILEIEARREEIERLGTADTVYFGGGTPSVLGERALERVLDALHEHVDLADGTSISFEANPEDVTSPRLELWRRLGVDALTLGIQALDDDSLGFLGRGHSATEARRAIERAVAAGFRSVSFDLIYGLPGQTAESWAATLEKAASLGTQHLSCYQLTIEPGTPFARDLERGTLIRLPEEVHTDLFFLAHDALAEHGFHGYEVSNLARGNAFRSRHNQKYWRHVPYLGLGPSAHSFDGRVRRWNERHLRRWARRLNEGGTAEADQERLSKGQLATEAVMLGLRTRDGIDRAACRARCGIDPLSGNEARVEGWVADGLLEPLDTADRIAPTLHGLAVADRLAREWDVRPADTDA